MKKPYLLIAGEQYYPSSGTDDWKGCYETIEEIMDLLKVDPEGWGSKPVTINGTDYDWYYIIDLRVWAD